ncbi:Helix-turn-helix domain protein [compost metagenome]|uniref:AraC family transcriptional regulator, ethanolamine operon transcriptional activator n=1 Tax=Pseudomonas jinjuensis TaxID=198616 RepID=A0A1H0D499_9PSED|nr:helix-turn-helix domain-containing protein [Pseudomonas jinjuensis]SDN64916.1 AraC family transcriptional regulator, ethanolamine operon transcriptional activator [Pseudomonas jinjuensis]
MSCTTAIHGRSEKTPPIAYQTIETRDVFQQAECLRKWEQNYIQIGGGTFSGLLKELSLGGIQLFRESMDKAVDEQGKPWPNSFAIGVPVEVVGDGYWCGDRLSRNSIFSLRPNSELKFRTPDYSDIYVAVLDIDSLESYSDLIEETSLERILTLSGVEEVPERLSDAFRASFDSVLQSIESNPGILDSGLSQRVLLNDLMQHVFGALVALNRIEPHGRRQFVHRYIVERAREYILSRKEEPPTVLEICQELKVSRRTLHYGFIKVLGINPVTFLRYLRLNGARQDLLSSDALTIGEIAARWGFWHMGMFASYYRQLFGETPSATLRSKPEPHVVCWN